MRSLQMVVALAAAFSSPLLALAPQEIDAYFEARWTQKGLAPAPLAADGAFLRRAWLDIAGVVPPPADVIAFEADPSPGKRSHAIERLLSGDRYAAAWSARLQDLLLESEMLAKNRMLARPFDLWLTQSLAGGMPYDEMVRKLIAGQGAVHENPEVSYVAQFRESPEALTGHLAKRFLGLQIQCAQCHDHPFEKWTRKDFYGLHAFFARVKQLRVPVAGLAAVREGRPADALEMMPKLAKLPGRKDRLERRLEKFARNLPPPSLSPEAIQSLLALRKEVAGAEMRPTFLVFDAPRGEAVMPDLKAPPTDKKKPVGEPVSPRFLDGTEPEESVLGPTRREALARWMTAPENPWFARALVNRVWAILMGSGLTQPVDNIAQPDSLTHAPLLDRLATHFVQSRYDLRGLIRLIGSTSVYQRSASASSTPTAAVEFAVAATRPMEPEQLFNSLLAATGTESWLREKGGEEFEVQRARMMARFGKVFENDGDAGSEDAFHGSLSQALFLMNAPALHKAVSAGPRGTVREAIEAAFRAGKTSEGVAHLYRAAYARAPNPDEATLAASFLDGSGAASQGRPVRGRPQGWSDLMWALISSAEFLVNH